MANLHASGRRLSPSSCRGAEHQDTTTLGITTSKYVVSRVEEKAFFLVAFVTFGPDPVPPSALESVAKAERDHMLRTVNGKVGSETPITLGNLPGREFHISTVPQGTIIERFYLAKVNGKHRVYLVVAAGDTLTPNTGDAVRFFDSFKTDASALPPTFAAPGTAFKPFQLPRIVPPPSRLQPRPIRGPRLPPRGIPRRLAAEVAFALTSPLAWLSLEVVFCCGESRHSRQPPPTYRGLSGRVA